MSSVVCCICKKSVEAPKEAYSKTLLWVSLGESSGFSTDEIDLCFKCSGALLWELKTHIFFKLGLKKT